MAKNGQMARPAIPWHDAQEDCRGPWQPAESILLNLGSTKLEFPTAIQSQACYRVLVSNFGYSQRRPRFTNPGLLLGIIAALAFLLLLLDGSASNDSATQGRTTAGASLIDFRAFSSVAFCSFCFSVFGELFQNKS